MIGKLVGAAAIALAVAVVVQALPDLKRYLEIREM
jgi:hypothetical protein